jgi:predicted NBD/HSP70 family sugar kinase
MATARVGADSPDGGSRRAGTTARKRANHARSDFRANRLRLLQTLLEEGPSTRARLCDETGLSRATVSALTNHFLRDGTVVERTSNTTPSRAGGRPPMLVRLAAQAGVVVGVGAAAQRDLMICVASLGHEVLRSVTAPGIRPDESVHNRIATLGDLIRDAVEGAGLDIGEDVLGVSLGVAAPVTGPLGRLPQAGIDPYGQVPAPAESLTVRLGVPVVQENDANLGALAEGEWGAAKGANSYIYLLTGYGVGAGLVLDGALLRGAWGTAGEIGHVPVRKDGEQCRCGNRGCLDTVAGGGYLVTRLAAQGLDVSSPDDVVHLAVEGNPLARAALDESAEELGTVLAGVLNLLNPERVVVGGAFAADPAYLDRLRERVAERTLRAAQDNLTLVPGSLGQAATALGGVAYLIRQPARTNVAARLRTLAT